jgi:hypothetical protein
MCALSQTIIEVKVSYPSACAPCLSNLSVVNPRAAALGMIMLARLGHSPREMTGVLWARVRSPPPKVRERLKGGDRVPPSPREARGIVGLAHSINGWGNRTRVNRVGK